MLDELKNFARQIERKTHMDALNIILLLIALVALSVPATARGA